MNLALAFADAAANRSPVLDLVILLAAAAVVAMLLRRASLATIPSFLICGVLIGPSVLGLITSTGNVESISQVAVILLMFTIGLHMDMGEFAGGMGRVLVMGVASTVVSVLALLPITSSGELGVPGGIAAAIALSMSSTAVVMRIIAERRETHKSYGRIIFGTLVVQDLLAIGGLALMPVLASWAGATPPGAGAGAHGHGEAVLLPAGWPIAARAAVALGGIIALIIVARIVLIRLLAEAARGAGPEVMLVLSAAAALGSALIASGLGFSAELGAFLAGLILASTPFRYQLAGQISPMRDLFMAVFFTAVGMKMDIASLASSWPLIAMALVATLVLKTAAITLTVWLVGATAPVALVCGMSICQAGEFTIVLLSEAAGTGLISGGALAGLTAVVVLTLILTPTLYDLGHRLAPRLARVPMAGWSRSAKLRELPPMPADAAVVRAPRADGGAVETPAPQPLLARYVVIAGFGVVGRALADRLEVAGVPFCVVDLNPATVETQRRLGRNAVYGDITNHEVLTSANVEAADAVLLTIPDDEATLRACREIRHVAPDAFIAARTSFLSKAMVAAQQGADHVTIEEVATAEAMARQVMDRLTARAQRGRG